MTTNNQNANITRTLSSASPLNATYHNSLRKMKNDDKCFYRNHSLKRSFKKINNDSSYTHQFPSQQHHCTIELKTKAASCLHLFHKNTPVMLTTFKNQQQQQIDTNDQQKTNEFLWHYQLSQCDLSKKIKASSHCNLNILRSHHQHHHLPQQQQQQHELHSANNHCNSINPLIAAETRFHNSLENQTTL